MSIHRSWGWKSLALVALLGCASCLGPNHATGQLFNWNHDLGNKWIQSGAFIVLSPVYLVFQLGDNMIFNPVQWWTGSNPIAEPEGIEDFRFVKASAQPLEGGTR